MFTFSRFLYGDKKDGMHNTILTVLCFIAFALLVSLRYGVVMAVILTSIAIGGVLFISSLPYRWK
jgi:hypothetical protein